MARLVTALLALYPDKDPQRISNREIARFLGAQKSTPEDVEELRRYFADVIRAPRRAFVEFQSTSRPANVSKEVGTPARYEGFRQLLAIRRYSPATEKSYKSALVSAQQWMTRVKNRPLEQMTERSAQEYFLWLTETKQVSHSRPRRQR